MTSAAYFVLSGSTSWRRAELLLLVPYTASFRRLFGLSLTLKPCRANSASLRLIRPAALPEIE